MSAALGVRRCFSMRTIIYVLLLAALSHGAVLAQAPLANPPATQLPKSIQNLAATLRAMDQVGIANQLIADYQNGRVILGAPGSNAMTSPPLIVPGITGRANNVMTLDRAQMENACDNRMTDRNPVTHGTLTWALTVVHEYTHMNQDNPQQTPRFENGAWRDTLDENQRWMRNVMSQITEIELHMGSGADKAERLERLEQLIRTLNDLKTVHNTTINDLKQEIAAGSVGTGLEWRTVDMGGTRDLDQVIANANSLVNTFIANTRNSIARFRREAGAPTVAQQGQPESPAPAKPLPAPGPAVASIDGTWKMGTATLMNQFTFSGGSGVWTTGGFTERDSMKLKFTYRLTADRLSLSGLPGTNYGDQSPYKVTFDGSRMTWQSIEFPDKRYQLTRQ